MSRILKNLFTTLIVILFSIQLKAQHFTHDIGVYGGFASIQADYGQRGDFSSNFENQGISLTLAHYLHFFNKNMRWSAQDEMYNYIMVKTEINYISERDFQHYGKFAKANSPSGERLREMTGAVSMINLGISLEYYFNNLEEFIYPFSDLKFNPYFSFGLRYVLFRNSLESSLGDWRTDPTVLPEKYRPNNATQIGFGTTFAAVIGGGLRYKLTENLDLSTLVSFQYFFSDEIDGLTARTSDNRNDERLINFQFGIVYHLNFSAPLFSR